MEIRIKRFDFSELEKSTAYATYCLSCEGGYTEPDFGLSGPTVEQRGVVLDAIKNLGLTGEEVDDAVEKAEVGENREATSLVDGYIGVCIHPDDFLEVVKELVFKKF